MSATDTVFRCRCGRGVTIDQLFCPHAFYFNKEIEMIDPASSEGKTVTEDRPIDPFNMDTMIQPKITGYRQLNADEAALMNEAKALAEQVGAFVAKLRGRLPMPPLDQRWISIGATDLQTGFMALIRGIAQPTTF